MAHEAAHVVQQQEAPQVQRLSADTSGALEHDAHQASQAVVAGQGYTVRERTSGPRAQPLWNPFKAALKAALDWIADKANLIPGFRMFTIILGVNPVNMSSVDRSAANILRAMVEFMPGGGVITRVLDTYGVFEKAGAFLERQIASLGMVGSAFGKALKDFLGSLGLTDLARPGSVWDRAKRIFTDPIDQLKNLAKTTFVGILELIKDAILRPLAKLAEGTAGYDLLKAVLGKDPITGDPVPQTADALIGGFMKLIGQEEVYNNLKKANAVARALAWFKGVLSGLFSFVTQIPGLLINAIKSLTITDIVVLPSAFIKVGRAFAGFAARFFSWAIDQVLGLLQIIFEVLAPGAMPYIRKAAGAFKTIVRNPIGFIGNLVRAGIQGFRQFAGNFLTHLRTSLIGWLTGTMSGAAIYIPQAFNLREILKFVLSVLGLTWQNIRAKLVRAIGETAVRVLETGFDIVVTLVTQGPAAAWEKIQESLSNLRDMVMGEVMTFVRNRVVQAAITKLLTSLNPAGAFIQAVIAIYNTVMFFIERLKQIAQVAMSVIDAIAAIAAGVIGPAANRVEQTMAGLLTLVISFLARIAGLGKVSDAVINIVNKVRAPIDRALDKVVEWIVATARRLGKLAVGAVRGAVARVVEWWRSRKTFSGTDGSSHALYFQGQGAGAVPTVASTPTPVRAFLSQIRTQATGSTDPAVRNAYAGAVAKVAEVDTVRNRVESGPNPRQPQDIDDLNTKMEQLANLLKPLVALVSTSAVPAGAAPVAVGELIKVTRNGRIAVVTALAPPLVRYRFIRPGQKMPAEEGLMYTKFGSEYTKHVADPRDLYMGATPRVTDPVGARVKNRMKTEGKLVVQNNIEQVINARDGQHYPVAGCDMGHVIDAVTWWNSNGRLTGAQSSIVIAFMNNPINYELEPSAQNRARGASLAGRGIRYLPPVV